MLRPRSMLPLVAIVATLLACGGPGTRGADRTPVLGPYALARTSVVSPVRAEPPAVQDRGGAAILRDSRRMCDLHGGKGSC